VLRTSTHGEITRIWMVPGLLGRWLHSVSAYQLGDTLVDSGCPATARELAAWCEGRGIRRVVHTHHHEDHIGGDLELVRRQGVEVLAPPRTVPVLAAFYDLPWYRRLVWGRAHSVRARPFGERVEIGGHDFRVLPTPGHCSDHCCFFQPELGWLFSGDLYIHPRVTYLRCSEDARTILQSLRAVLALEPQLLICSHAGFVENACERLEQRIAYWEDLGRRAASLADRGVGVGRISRRLLGAEGVMTLISGGDFSKVNLIRALLRSSERNSSALV
jgi:glyoxylase-like metal-dependent hydrolase (beta-lactamase superfamily II)